MNNNSYTTTIEFDTFPQDVFNSLSKVSEWWTADFEGSSTNTGDEFVICHPGAHYSRQRLVEVIPGKKVVWLVTESELPWLNNPAEWAKTRMVFDIYGDGNKTRLRFAHEGLVPELECYSRVTAGWNMVINEQLFNYITTGKTI